LPDVTPLLPRYYRRQQEIEAAREVIEAIGRDEEPPPQTTVSATLPGDRARLRGVPCVSPGVPGAIRGTVPHLDGIREPGRR
jgi:hypothetical protein